MAPKRPSGPCIKAGCDESAGHGPKNLMCPTHAAMAADSAARIISLAAPDTMIMHEGQPAALPCGHTAYAGDHVVSVFGQWMCAGCAVSQKTA